jgi:hypothetical protein
MKPDKIVFGCGTLTVLVGVALIVTARLLDGEYEVSNVAKTMYVIGWLLVFGVVVPFCKSIKNSRRVTK